jgi:hypothetical protein
MIDRLSHSSNASGWQGADVRVEQHGEGISSLGLSLLSWIHSCWVPECAVSKPALHRP